MSAIQTQKLTFIGSTSFGFAQNTLHYFQNTVMNTNQSVENAGVAFVKGGDERNEFFEKINEQ